MFTGLIEDIGTISSIKRIGNGAELIIESNFICDDLKIDDSVSINGVCLTATNINQNKFQLIAVDETLKKTNVGNLRTGSKVNLERAVKANSRLGGHIVQGHVDCIGKIKSILPQSKGYILDIEYPFEYRKYLINTGSITVNGVSLTVAKIENKFFKIAIIPHTWGKTTFHLNKVNDSVNLEFDLLGKYIENMVIFGNKK